MLMLQSIDSSAAETIAKIYELCAANKVRLCYSRGSILCKDFRMKRVRHGRKYDFQAEQNDDAAIVYVLLIHLCTTSYCFHVILFKSYHLTHYSAATFFFISVAFPLDCF